MLMSFAPGLVMEPRLHADRLMGGRRVRCPRNPCSFEAEHHVGVGDMPRALSGVGSADDREGKFMRPLGRSPAPAGFRPVPPAASMPCGVSRGAAGDDHRVLARRPAASPLRSTAADRLRRRVSDSFGIAQLLRRASGMGSSCSIAVGHDHAPAHTAASSRSCRRARRIRRSACSETGVSSHLM